MISEAARGEGILTFVPSGEVHSIANVWKMSSDAARWLANRTGPDAPVAVVMDSSVEAVALALAVWRSGRRLVSMPMPPRGSSLELYRRFIEDACASTHAQILLVAASYVPLIPPLSVAVDSFEATLEQLGHTARYVEQPESAELVQFTSGSTSDPKGVVVPISQLAANIHAIHRVLSPRPGDVACSWLPLSHDMGLVGMLLTGMCACTPDLAGPGNIVLIRPEWFLRRPESWLQACSDHSATITAAPDFGFSHAVRRSAATPSLDLSSLRVCITGAEPVRAATLRTFGATFDGSGFDERAFCPAYGMAEAGLAVSLTEPNEMWTSLVVDPDALQSSRVLPCEHGKELVSAGAPLAGYAVDVDGREGAVGRLTIRGPSLFAGYVPAQIPERTVNDPFVTNDAGFIHDGRVFVTGRLDDVVVIGGRNLYLNDLEEAAILVTGTPPGRVQAIRFGGGYALVTESGDTAPSDLANGLRRAAISEIGVGPESVLVVAPGSLPRTPSGKPQRKKLAASVEAGEVDIVHQLGAK